MNALFYPKLAAGNIRKNARTYIPYILTCIFTIAMYYIMSSLTKNEGILEVYGGGTVQLTLSLGCWVIGIFSFIFLFYTNSFLIKNRKKEFGLFNILGMEKKHIAKVIFYESLYVFVISMFLGFAAGILLDKLMYLLISRLINAEISLGFYISTPAMLSSAVLFGIIFLLIFLNSVRLISLSKPIELLSGGSVGEKEPKAKWLIAILGLIFLGSGYYIAVTVTNPVDALSLFFIAVILVIIGTYLLFTAGSIALLKILKRNKKYYYQTKHFISVSGMIYRMKQNAVGLANICILSTMVLVMVSSTASLMVGLEDVIKERYPFQLSFEWYGAGEEDFSELTSTVNKAAEDENVVIERQMNYTSLEFVGVYQGGDEIIVSDGKNASMINDLCFLNIITEDDYLRMSGEDAGLEDGQVLVWTDRLAYNQDHLILFGERYNIIKKVDKAFYNGSLAPVSVYPFMGIIVKDRAVLEKLYQGQLNAYGDHASSIVSYCLVDIKGDDDAQTGFYEKAKQAIREAEANMNMPLSTSCRVLAKQSVTELYGSLFFLGIFLGLLFTMAAVLIIYYKQISEGFDDKKRFEIMQKVGLGESEIKKSIHSQILTVFFLPLIMAGIHVGFAFPIIRKILTSFALNNILLYAATTAVTFLVFTLIYAAIYSLTAKAYYGIVKMSR